MPMDPRRLGSKALISFISPSAYIPVLTCVSHKGVCTLDFVQSQLQKSTAEQQYVSDSDTTK